jgi:hypothetical protein
MVLRKVSLQRWFSTRKKDWVSVFSSTKSIFLCLEPPPVVPRKMDSFHELHIDIPLNEYLNSEPNSSTITPSPKPDVIPDVSSLKMVTLQFYSHLFQSELSTLKRSHLKPVPFIELVRFVTSTCWFLLKNLVQLHLQSE